MKIYLAEWLEEKGMTTDELIEKCGNKRLVSRNYINRWLEGNVSPSLQAIDLISSTLGISIDTLIHRTPEDECKEKVIENPRVAVVTRYMKDWMRVFQKTVKDVESECGIRLTDHPDWYSSSFYMVMDKEDFYKIAKFVHIDPETFATVDPHSYYDRLLASTDITTKKHKTACRIIRYFQKKHIFFEATAFRARNGDSLYHIHYETMNLEQILPPWKIIWIGMNPIYKTVHERKNAPDSVRYGLMTLCDFRQL